METHTEYLTAKQAARICGVRVETVRGWCRRGELEGCLRLRSGRSWYYRIPRESVLSRLEVVRPSEVDRAREVPAAAALPEWEYPTLREFGIM